MKIIIKLIPYYWIIQGLLIAITIRGLGSLTLDTSYTKGTRFILELHV